MRADLLAISVLAMSLSACSAATVTPLQNPQRRNAQVDKWFVILAEMAGEKCSLSVYPQDAAEGNVAVKPGWRVGWLLVDRCHQTPQAPVLEFRHKKVDPTETKRPIEFDNFSPDDLVLAGKVRKKLFGGCPDDAPCGEYKYTVKVGTWTLDPDIEIVH